MMINRRRIINLLLLTILLYTITLQFGYYDKWTIFPKPVQVDSSKGNIAQVFDDKPKIELTVRMSLHGNMIERLFCMYLRSAVVFWYSGFGDVVFILDEADRSKKFEETLLTAELPFSTRVVYEPDPPPELEKVIMDHAIRVGRRKTPGYIKMFYSSFLFDYYTSESAIVAWADLDITFTMPVVMDSIFRNGKLIVKGFNQFDVSWIRTWSRTTWLAVGFAMPADFMVYFPSYVYATTIRNCREYITKRHKTNTFEEAFAVILGHGGMISPINIILTYAYYFERDRYHWNIDIGLKTLDEYNREFISVSPDPLLPNDIKQGQYVEGDRYPRSKTLQTFKKETMSRNLLLPTDIKPELHVTIHTGHYKPTTDPLEQGICYTQLYLGMKNIPHCEKFRNTTNMELFVFERSKADHLRTWCGGEGKRVCKDIIEERYKTFVEVYKGNEEWLINTSKIDAICKVARQTFNVKCPSTKYVPFPLKKNV